MKLEHSFTVPVGIDEAWRILLDIERIGPCMPGAIVDSVDGDDFTGTVKVKLGPIGLTYKGKASFIEKDEAAHRAVIDARGRDARGNGTAAAKVTATLAEDTGQTKVHVDTELDITGKPAQFGRGVMVDVGNKLIGQFADCLASTITSGDGGAMTETGNEAPAEAAPKAAAKAAAKAPAKAAKKTAAKAGAGEAAKPKAAPRKRTPRPKPAAKSTPPDVHPETQPATHPETQPATQPGPAPAETESVAAEAESVTAEAVATEGAAANDPAGTPAGDPVVDEAALEAVAETPAYSAPSAEANGRQSAPRAVPERDVEPINLIESAGPAVAKRLAPVAVAGLVLLIGLRRRRRRRR